MSEIVVEREVDEARQRVHRVGLIEREGVLRFPHVPVDLLQFGGDLAKFVREGETRSLFAGREVLSLLTGEPEYLDPLGSDAPKNWVVTGYPWYAIKTPEHDKFLAAYQKKFNDYPRIASLVGYATYKAIAAGIARAGSTDSEKLADAFSGLTFDTPSGKVTFRPQDHQSTLGLYVGRTGIKDGKGTMTSFEYVDGRELQPSDAEVKKFRGGS
jgi:branched-chain amino acid transport system substrate-binding protein